MTFLRRVADCRVVAGGGRSVGYGRDRLRAGGGGRAGRLGLGPGSSWPGRAGRAWGGPPCTAGCSGCWPLALWGWGGWAGCQVCGPLDGQASGLVSGIRVVPFFTAPSLV